MALNPTPTIRHNFPPVWQDMGPFTTSLSPEAQQLLGPGLDPNDPFTSVLMAGSENYISNPYYPWRNVQGNCKLAETTITMHPSCNGMSATLAPSVLEFGADTLSATTPPSNDNNTVPSSGLGFNFSQEGKAFDSYSPDAFRRVIAAIAWWQAIFNLLSGSIGAEAHWAFCPCYLSGHRIPYSTSTVQY
jgi:hypothetical protein